MTVTRRKMPWRLAAAGRPSGGLAVFAPASDDLADLGGGPLRVVEAGPAPAPALPRQ